MKVKELRRILNKALNLLDTYDDDTKVKMVSNTYFLDGAYYFLGVSGIYGGYINLEEPVDEDDYDDYEEEDEE